MEKPQTLHWLVLASVVLGIGVWAAPCRAQQTGVSNPSGGTFIEIQDGQPRNCLNINKDLLSAYVVVVKARQNTSWLPPWLVATKDVGVRVNTTLTDPSTQSPVFNFPRAKALRPVGSTDVVALPLIMPLLQRYNLINEANKPPSPIAGINFDVDFINVEQTGAVATVFGQLADFTKQLPVPPDPYTTGVQLFGDFANQVLDSVVASDNSANSEDIGSFAYDLATSDNECASNPRALTEGTTGVIFDYSGNNLSGVIKTSDAPKYCFSMAQNAAEVQFALKPGANFDCETDPRAKSLPYSILNNPQIVFSFSIIAKAGVGQITRLVPAQGVTNATEASEAALGSFARHLAASGPLSTASEASLLPDIGGLEQSIGKWVHGIQTGNLPVSSAALQPTRGALTSVELPAAEARAYDAARSILRCKRDGIPAATCG